MPLPQLVFTQDAPTTIKGTHISQLKVGQWRKFTGGPLGRHRRQIVITNDDNVNKLSIIRHDGQSSDPDTSTDKIMTIFPNTSITLFTNDAIVIKNTLAGNDIDGVFIIETFYT